MTARKLSDAQIVETSVPVATLVQFHHRLLCPMRPPDMDLGRITHREPQGLLEGGAISDRHNGLNRCDSTDTFTLTSTGCRSCSRRQPPGPLSAPQYFGARADNQTLPPSRSLRRPGTIIATMAQSCFCCQMRHRPWREHCGQRCGYTARQRSGARF